MRKTILSARSSVRVLLGPGQDGIGGTGRSRALVDLANSISD